MKIADILGPRTKDFNPILGTPRKKTQEETERIANYLVEKFKSPEYKPVFLKAAWRLEKGTIDRLVGNAFERGSNPRAYFIASVKKEKTYYG